MLVHFLIIFSSKRATIVWTILERISGLDSSLEMTDPRYVNYSTVSRIWAFLGSDQGCLSLFCEVWLLHGDNLPEHLLPPFQNLQQCHMQSGSPPMLTLPSSSSIALLVIRSGKILKKVDESRQPCRNPSVLLNHSPILSLNSTAICALSYTFSMIRMMLLLMLFFLTAAHKVSCHNVKSLLLTHCSLETPKRVVGK